jgi:predicted HTH transcriptional regulator
LLASLPALSRQIIEMAKTRSEITVREIEDTTQANRNTIKSHLKKLTEQNYLLQLGKGRGVRYVIK